MRQHRAVTSQPLHKGCNSMSNIDFNYVQQILDYCPFTGNFTWKIRVNSKVSAGTIAGTPHNRGYIHITIKGKKFLAHRLAWMFVNKTFPQSAIDHINGIKTDNRIDNLRTVTSSENLQNQRKPRGKNPYLGVSFNKNTNKWQAHITVNKVQKNLGNFDTAELANEKYLSAKRIYHPSAPVN
jgi:hypothetical protein